MPQRFHAGTLPLPAQRGLAEFLSQYGHRAVAEIDIGMPRWSDDPAHILGVLANYLRLEDTRLAPDVFFARGAREAEAMIDTLVGRAAQALPAARAPRALRPGSVAAALRSARAAEVLHRPGPGGSAAGACRGRRGAWRAAESIESAGDVFFLDLAEARAALPGGDLRRLVAERRQAYETELRRRHVPRVILSDGTEPEALTLAATPTGRSARGHAGVGGHRRGSARVVLDPVGAHLEPGEILVAPSTDPGWTPLFLTAGGLVMEMGGANSHGAVVAREYGIPAVVGVAGATQRIRTGQRVRVDGTAGVVTPAAQGATETA